jgi:hypothetical protein
LNEKVVGLNEKVVGLNEKVGGLNEKVGGLNEKVGGARVFFFCSAWCILRSCQILIVAWTCTRRS